MKRFLTLTGMFALVSVLLMMPISAKNGDCSMQGDGKGMGMMMEHQSGGIMNIPDLTDDQIAKIEKIGLNHQKKMAELRYKSALKMIDLHEAMQINIDEKKALSAVEELGKIDTEIQKAKISHHFQIRNILTKDQQKLFDMKRVGMKMKNEKGMKYGNNGQNNMEDCGNCSK
ncbi:MAG: Spy/CpxP family protein refolding chaperone [bacterium]